MLNHRKNTAKLSSCRFEETKVPQVLILRDSSDLESSYETMRTFFTNVEPMGPAGGNWQDSFLGERNGLRCTYVSVPNASMAVKAVRRFGRAGGSLVLYMGCCAVKTQQIESGDLFMVTEAYQCKGISKDLAEIKCVPASYDGAELAALQFIRKVHVHWGRVYSTAMDYLVEEYLPPPSLVPGCWAADRYTATVFSAAQQFGIHRTAILYVRHNFLTGKHDTENVAETSVRCRRGEEQMVQTILEIIRSYSEKIQTSAPYPPMLHSDQISLPVELDDRIRFWQAAVDCKM